MAFLQKDIDREGLPLDTDVVINLSGKSIGNIGTTPIRPWTNSLKKSIESSRYVCILLWGMFLDCDLEV